MPTSKCSEIIPLYWSVHIKLSEWKLLAWDVMALLYQHNFLYRGYLEKEVKGQQNTKLTFSVSNMWFQYHLEGKSLVWQICWSSQVIPFWNACFAIPASEFNLKLFPTIRTVHLSTHTIMHRLPCSTEKFHSCEVTCIFGCYEGMSLQNLLLDPDKCILYKGALESISKNSGNYSRLSKILTDILKIVFSSKENQFQEFYFPSLVPYRLLLL